MSAVITQHFFYKYRWRLERARAQGALMLLLVFVLAGGHRALEGWDEDC